VRWIVCRARSIVWSGCGQCVQLASTACLQTGHTLNLWPCLILSVLRQLKLRFVLKADIAMSTVNKKCWSAEFLDALHGLEWSGDFQHRVRTLQTIPQSEFVVDVKKKLRSNWSQANQLGNENQTDCHAERLLHPN